MIDPAFPPDRYDTALIVDEAAVGATNVIVPVWLTCVPPRYDITVDTSSGPAVSDVNCAVATPLEFVFPD